MCNIFKNTLLTLMVVASMATNATAPHIEAPVVSVTQPTTEPTESVTEPPTEPSTEPVYEEIDIPTIIELPTIESFKTIYDVENAIVDCNAAVAEYDEILSSLPPEHPQYDDIFQLKMELLNVIDEYTEVLDKHWESREERRPVMTYIWKALKNYGWSDAVVAGVIGNLIAETGGMGYQDIEWDIKVNGYYGICMWALQYVPEIEGASLDEQLDYLTSSIEREMNHVYSKSFRKKFGILDLQYDDFLKIDNPYDAAIAFAVCYERPSAKHVRRRGPQAEKAYDYFVNLGTWPWPGQ